MAEQREPTIYLDYHASTPLDPRVREAMWPHLTEAFGNPHSNDHAAGWRAGHAVEAALAQVAAQLGVDPDEVILTSGATEANNLAVLGLARRAAPTRRRILISAIEHKCVSASAAAMAREGFALEVIPVDPSGRLDLSSLEDRLGDDVLLVSVMAVNNEIGTVQDTSAISRLADKCGAFFHSDFAQALGAGLTIDVNGPGLASLSAHKIYGPKGIGALYVRRDIQRHLEPLMYGGGQQGGLRPGTVPVALAAGLAKAVSLMRTEQEELSRIKGLRDSLVERVLTMSSSTLINGPETSIRHPGNANLQFIGFDARDLLAAVQPFLSASTGSACTSGEVAPSHVLRAIGLSVREAESSIRFGLGRFSSPADVDTAVTLLAAALSSAPTNS